MLISHKDLSADALYNLAASVVLREGTDYGDIEAGFDEKVSQLITQIKSGHAVILYSESEEEVDILPKETFAKRLASE